MTDNQKRFLKQVEGAVLGFAAADALGVPVEFTTRGERLRDPVREMRSGGAHGQPAGTWSDDTSMTLCMLCSLTEKGIDYEDQMARFADWMQNGSYTATGEVFDIGGATHRAISKYLRGTPALSCGDDSEHACGNGSLMRIMPLALYLAARGCRKLDGETAELIHRASDCTHAHRRCEMACGIYCSVIFHLCVSDSPSEAVETGLEEALRLYGEQPAFRDCLADVAALKSTAALPAEDIRSGGYVLDTLQAALWCLLTTDRYADCALKAVNLGRDTDTTAAVAGALAGLCYGAEAIPADWLAVLAKAEELRALCGRFAAALASSPER